MNDMVNYLVECLKEYKLEEFYHLEGDEVPFYVIVSQEPEKVIEVLQSLDDLEADVVVLSPEEKEAIGSTNSEIAAAVSKAIEKGQKVL
ncbi:MULTISPECIES: hypothetical protein [Kosmotoga]|jgi:Glu-tRNA(Gln) amidotransferase subunit E-like FAD-binding protein|uniref:Uncharacterized protein n=1 Tax=Kosmotoga olearia (strain ATCC BAA-1733 / DSM 21960 / TBF 19.5.1) TaxID=521045 RepID=C5CIG9_KOSOT|nr:MULTISPECIES: hypothetical protein [Kosmotoga]ACR78903.1 hypothetical protein Kole_0177 [Kosmotoga olearia TBF 19.5.1]MDI3524367.1 hypothetical protein [Kosmotoga sp.]MDK2953637.1 hypothetical protein [Kosmotoga sp.]OAA24881.1 hypothetical protein DU53_00770 [Kosmotoga sp. DU53]